MNHFLAGDIGATKTRLAIAEVAGAQVRIDRETSYQSRDFATFEALLADFLAGSPSLLHAAFGIAGPLRGRVVQTTNLPWHVDADALQRQFGFAHCTLLNDLEATACGLAALGADDLLILQPGMADAGGNAAAVIADAALSGRDEICVETLQRFVRLYGAEAGNLALKIMSRGGLYLGGGIAPKILPLLQGGAFLEAFLSKGRMRPLLEAMPVRVILNDRAAQSADEAI